MDTSIVEFIVTFARLKCVVLFGNNLQASLQVAATRQRRGGGNLEQIQCVFSSECFCYLACLFHFIRIQQRAVCKVDLD